jgi:hypothetical protein
MSPQLQTAAALAIVAITATWLVFRTLAKKRNSSCGGGDCGAISPEVRKLQARLKRQP